jgi:hypothetical protein
VNRFFLFLSLVFLIVPISIRAANPVCVRNYDKGTNYDICAEYPQYYAYLVGKNTNSNVCTQIQSEFYCDEAKQYVHVPTTTGETICVMNYNQPPVSNYCDSVPQYYDYVEGSTD